MLETNQETFDRWMRELAVDTDFQYLKDVSKELSEKWEDMILAQYGDWEAKADKIIFTLHDKEVRYAFSFTPGEMVAISEGVTQVYVQPLNIRIEYHHESEVTEFNSTKVLRTADHVVSYLIDYVSKELRNKHLI